MKKTASITAVILFLLSFSALRAQSTWSFDNSHSKVSFSVTHMTISEVDGEFKSYSGKVESKSDDFTDAVINFTIDTKSVTTGSDSRDGHLKSDDFFNADKYPTITFKSVSFKKISGNKYILEGDLTIRDVTKRVKLDVVYNGTVKDPYGNIKAGFKITGTINRLDFNLKWNSMADVGPVVGKDVSLVINVELKKL